MQGLVAIWIAVYDVPLVGEPGSGWHTTAGRLTGGGGCRRGVQGGGWCRRGMHAAQTRMAKTLVGKVLCMQVCTLTPA